MGKFHVAFFEVEPWEREHLSQLLPDAECYYSSNTADGEPPLPQAESVEIISVFIRSRIDERVLDRFPSLRLIATRSTGYDHIDLDACSARGIAVVNVPAYGENTVAEHTFGLILSLSRKIHQAYVRTSRGDFSLEGLTGFDLHRKTLGVIGAGRIGLHVIRIAKGFAMRVLAFDPHPDQLIAEVLGFEYVLLEDLLAESDIVTIHAPYSTKTHHFMDASKIRSMKPGALLINTARGPLIDTEALLEALDSGHLAGAGLDVLEGEELISEERALLGTHAAEEKLKAVVLSNVLLRREDVVVTPHIAFNSKEALIRILETTAENIRAFLAGEPMNIVLPFPAPQGSRGKEEPAA